MKAKVNLQMLNTTAFDSGALGVMAMVLHQFPIAGHYRVAIWERGCSLTNVGFEVDEKSEAMQLDIDLAQAVKAAKARPGDCACTSEKAVPLVVSPKGYVLFHASSGAGYSVTVAGGEGKDVFDSTKLAGGDLFAVSLLEPAVYSMTNTVDSVVGEVTASLPPDAAKRIRTLETRYIEVSRKKLDPERMELLSSQGLVFRVKDSARIVIKKTPAATHVRSKPAIRWQRLPTARTKSQR